MDDLDVEALLDEAFQNEGTEIKENGKSNQSKYRKRSRSRDRERSKRSRTPEKKRSSRRSRSRDRHIKRSKSRDRSRRSRDRSRRSRSRDKPRRSRSKDKPRRSRERVKPRKSRSPRRSKSPRRPVKRSSPPKPRERTPSSERFYNRARPQKSYRDPYQRHTGLDRSPERREERITPEERDARTVFCMQVSQRIRPSDLKEFFSSVGKVQDVRVITDNKTRRSKGIAYIEFAEIESVSLALGLDGQKLLGVPIIVQASQAEKNRAVPATAASTVVNKGPMRLYVGNLHQNISEEMMTGIFEPFGTLDIVTLIKNETGKSKGYGFVTFKVGDDALKAVDQLNGFELAGRCMKLHQHITQGADGGLQACDDGQTITSLDADDTEKKGFELGATGRLALMAKLAQGTGIKVPQLHQIQENNIEANPTTQCFMLSNMFNPNEQKTNSDWHQEISDDVIDECDKFGGCVHVYVDKMSSDGNVYVKCPTIQTAVASVGSLHGRYFAGQLITAAYVPLINYHTLFPQVARAIILLKKSAHVPVPLPPSYQF